MSARRSSPRFACPLSLAMARGYPERRFSTNFVGSDERETALARAPLDADAYRRDGFVKLPGFADPRVCEAMLARVVEIAETKAADPRAGPGLLLPEANLRGRPGRPAELASKIFRLHREPVFGAFASDVAVRAL